VVSLKAANGGLAHVLPAGPAASKNETIDCASMIFNNFGALLQDRITVKNESLKNQAQSTSTGTKRSQNNDHIPHQSH
jgi:hypothetical protein